MLNLKHYKAKLELHAIESLNTLDEHETSIDNRTSADYSFQGNMLTPWGDLPSANSCEVSLRTSRFCKYSPEKKILPQKRMQSEKRNTCSKESQRPLTGVVKIKNFTININKKDKKHILPYSLTGSKNNEVLGNSLRLNPKLLANKIGDILAGSKPDICSEKQNLMNSTTSGTNKRPFTAFAQQTQFINENRYFDSSKLINIPRVVCLTETDKGTPSSENSKKTISSFSKYMETNQQEKLFKKTGLTKIIKSSEAKKLMQKTKHTKSKNEAMTIDSHEKKMLCPIVDFNSMTNMTSRRFKFMFMIGGDLKNATLDTSKNSSMRNTSVRNSRTNNTIINESQIPKNLKLRLTSKDKTLPYQQEYIFSCNFNRIFTKYAGFSCKQQLKIISRPNSLNTSKL